MPVRVRRSEIRVTAAATPSSSTIRPRICAPNSELLRASGMVDESATGRCLFGLAGLPGAGVGTAEGLIWGKRLEALPAGIVVEMPGTGPTSGTVPSGMLDPRLRVEPAAPAVDEEEPDEELVPFVAEPPEPAVLLLLLGFGLGEVDGFVTVTVAVLVVISLVFSVTVMVAVKVILSPEAAELGTESWASACGVLGSDFGRLLMVQLVLLAQPTVNVGALMAGDLLLPFAASVTETSSLPAAQAEIVKFTDLPAWTLLSEAATARLGVA